MPETLIQERELLTRAATFQPSTFNAERRTVEVVFSTGAEVQRADFEGPYIERLSMESSAVDLSALIGGPVLDDHDRFSVRSILGIVESAAVDGKRGVATLRFSERPEVQGVAADVQSGIIRSVSAGYSVQTWETTKRADGMRIKTATRWMPKEISFTPLAADPQAKTRSAATGENMDLQTQLRGIADAVGVPHTFSDDLATRSIPLKEGRDAIIREAARRIPVIDSRAPEVTTTRDGGPELITRMADGLLSRISSSHKPEAGREFAYFRIADIAKRCLQERGLSTLGAPAEILTRALHSTSDFSAVLAEVYNKSLLTLRADQSPIAQVFKRATIGDFRKRHIMEISDGPGLEKVNEKGEITFGTITDSELASYKLDSYARGFGLTFQALQNDDLSALADLSAKMSRGARSWFTSFLASTILSNPQLADNKAVFHLDHGNLAAGNANPSDTTVQDAKLAMRLQTDASGNPIDAPPKFIAIPAGLETVVDKLLATLYPQVSDDAETATRGLVPLVIPHFDHLNQTAWYLFADPAIAPVFEYAELEGFDGPRVETEQGFEFLGVRLRVVWHLGAGAIDHRGAFKNPGVGA